MSRFALLVLAVLTGSLPTPWSSPPATTRSPSPQPPARTKTHVSKVTACPSPPRRAMIHTPTPAIPVRSPRHRPPLNLVLGGKPEITDS